MSELIYGTFTVEELINEAKKSREKAYAVYSGYKVGAALLCADGTVLTGCNVENSSYGATLCAERNALAAAVGQGKHEFSALAVIASEGGYCVPCGICLQVFSEFCGGNFKIFLCKPNGEYIEKIFSELYPNIFKLNKQ